MSLPLWEVKQGGLAAALDQDSVVGEVVQAVLKTMAAREGSGSCSTWVIHVAERTLTDVMIIQVGPRGGRPAAIVRLPQTPDSAASVQRHGTVIAALHAAERLAAWRTFVPVLLAAGTVGSQPYLVESRLPGQNMRDLVQADAPSLSRLRHAADSITTLHRLMGATSLPGEAVLAPYVEEPSGAISLLRRVTTWSGGDKKIVELRRVLIRNLLHRGLPVGWTHGDFWPANVLVAERGSTVTGIIDWDLASPKEPVIFDLLHLLVETRKIQAQEGELGQTVAALLNGAWWTAEERALLRRGITPWPDDVAGERALLLLYWLRFVGAYVAQCPGRVRDRNWVGKNVELVLRAI